MSEPVGLTLNDPDQFIEYAWVDWLVMRSWRVLHAVPADRWTEAHREDMALEWYVFTPVRLACERIATELHIPGIGSRMSLPRCRQCCRALGLPPGSGSPKNDDECRRILGLPAVTR